jgi:glutamate transport system permease protein
MNNVLYDAPGPRARRISLLVSIVSIALIGLGLWFFVYKPLKEQGHLSMARWGLLIDPSHPQFGNVWTLLREGARHRVGAAARPAARAQGPPLR